MEPFGEQVGVYCVLMRGGTSKAVFFHEDDIPPIGASRDIFLKRLMGSPDMLQIDGLGGSRLVTSKVAIVRKSNRSDADVDYTFAQIDTATDRIGYQANCGNISAAVGPFALDEGLIEATGENITVRIFNTNTQKVLISTFLAAKGKARVLGDRAIAGVPGTGSEVLLDYSNTVGAKTGRLLPTGSASERLELQDGTEVEVTICDVGNPCVFVKAQDLGLTGIETPTTINATRSAIERAAEIQARVGEKIGLWPDWSSVRLAGIPLLVAVAPPQAFTGPDGETYPAEYMDVIGRLIFLGQCHDTMAGTGSICTAAASRIEGSVVHRALSETVSRIKNLRIGHPMGVMQVEVAVNAISEGSLSFDALGIARTARRLMAGIAYVPALALHAHNSTQDVGIAASTERA